MCVHKWQTQYCHFVQCCHTDLWSSLWPDFELCLKTHTLEIAQCRVMPCSLKLSPISGSHHCMQKFHEQHERSLQYQNGISHLEQDDHLHIVHQIQAHSPFLIDRNAKMLWIVLIFYHLPCLMFQRIPLFSTFYFYCANRRIECLILVACAWRASQLGLDGQTLFVIDTIVVLILWKSSRVMTLMSQMKIWQIDKNKIIMTELKDKNDANKASKKKWTD